MPSEPQAQKPIKINRLGLEGGIAGILLSLGAGAAQGYMAALAFGFEATNDGVKAVLFIAVAVVGVVCGVLAVRGSLKARSVGFLVSASMVCAAMAGLGCLELLGY
ncbi:MAG TPA: hypothetical protein VFS19_00680 [Planctomycetota bacterium]|nr:hypothetical protein [Planctomycetota bacterium]